MLRNRLIRVVCAANLEIDGPTSISDKMFDAMVRFVTIAILVREYPQDIMIYLTKEFSK